MVIDKCGQAGLTLIEVLVALLIFGVGILGAAAVQLKALKYTDSALMSTQASFIAYDMLDRMRANSAADYRLSSLDAAQSEPADASVLGQDLSHFKTAVRQFGGASARGSIAINNNQVVITLGWDDSRAASTGGTRHELVIKTRVAASVLKVRI